MRQLNNNDNVQQSKIDLALTTEVTCEKCKSSAFNPGAVILRKVSALLTGGKEGYLPIQVFSCAACGHVNQDFLPQELRTPSIKV